MSLKLRFQHLIFIIATVLYIQCSHLPILPEKAPPTNLVFNPDSLVLTVGDSATSLPLSVEGDTPMIYVSNTTPPSSNEIFINARFSF